MAERTIRTSPGLVATSAELKKQYLDWVNRPDTRNFITMVHDHMVRRTVSESSPLAGQEALGAIKRQEGAIQALSMLLNLDNPERFIEPTDVEATWAE